MFFILSKTIALLLRPSILLIVVGLAGLVLMRTRFRRAGRSLAAASLVLLLALGMLPIGYMLINVLENRFPPWDPARGAPDGIIILGGAVSPGLSSDRGAPQLSDSAERVLAIGTLARQFPHARIIYSGGSASLLPGRPREADFLGPLLDSLGVPRERVILENRSRNTVENALFSKEIAHPKPGERWLLVTSAVHMPRSVGCFRRAGFPVEAYPVDWTTVTRPRFIPSLSPLAGLGRLDAAAHEWEGLLAYWVTGRTSAFLPAP